MSFDKFVKSLNLETKELSVVTINALTKVHNELIKTNSDLIIDSDELFKDIIKLGNVYQELCRDINASKLEVEKLDKKIKFLESEKTKLNITIKDKFAIGKRLFPEVFDNKLIRDSGYIFYNVVYDGVV